MPYSRNNSRGRPPKLGATAGRRLIHTVCANPVWPSAPLARMTVANVSPITIWRFLKKRNTQRKKRLQRPRPLAHRKVMKLGFARWLQMMSGNLLSSQTRRSKVSVAQMGVSAIAMTLTCQKRSLAPVVVEGLRSRSRESISVSGKLASQAQKQTTSCCCGKRT